MNSSHENEHHHKPSFVTPVVIWVILLALTAATILVARVDLGMFHFAAAFIIASIKAYLVMAYFMHLKYDSMMYTWMVIIALGMLAIFVILPYFDVAYRGSV